MSKATRNVGKPWTPEDVSALRHLLKLKTPRRIIGLKLGRTTEAINHKARGLRGVRKVLYPPAHLKTSVPRARIRAAVLAVIAERKEQEAKGK